jgi:hypothetical protein
MLPTNLNRKSFKSSVSLQPELSGEYAVGHSPYSQIATEESFPIEEPVLYEIGQNFRRIDNLQKSVYVDQGDGAISKDKPLVSAELYACSALVIRNKSSGEFLLMHLDFTANHECDLEGRFNYAEFMSGNGAKQVLLVEGDRSGCRERVAEAVAIKWNAELLPKLLVHSGEKKKGLLYGDKKDYRWDIVVRPENGEVVVHLKEVKDMPLLRFTEIFRD